MKFENRYAVVTGAAQGIGYGIAKKLLEEGVNGVAILDMNEERLNAVAAELNALGKGKALAKACNVADGEAVAAVIKEIEAEFGKIDILVNNACYGAGYGKGSQLEYMDDATFNKGIDGSIGVVFRGMREVVPYMKEHGGSIINYCSMYGLVSPDLRIYGDNPQKQPPNYGAGKAAVDQITRYAAGALAEYGIRVNAVTPGPFPNPRNQNDAEFNAKLAGKTMLGRFGQSYEMAGAVLLLASDASSFMTGTNIVVDGGWTAW